MQSVWILLSIYAPLAAALFPRFESFNQQGGYQRSQANHRDDYLNMGANQVENSRLLTKEEVAIAQARQAGDMRQEWIPDQREPATLFDRGWRDTVSEFSGWYGDDEDRYYDNNANYYDQDEYDEDDYAEEDDFFDKEELTAIDKETIANNENEIYRVKADLEYDEMRMERMTRKMALMERNMQKMRVALETKYPFGGYYRK